MIDGRVVFRTILHVRLYANKSGQTGRLRGSAYCLIFIVELRMFKYMTRIFYTALSLDIITRIFLFVLILICSEKYQLLKKVHFI